MTLYQLDLAGIDVSECIIHPKKSHIPCHMTLRVTLTHQQHVLQLCIDI